MTEYNGWSAYYLGDECYIARNPEHAKEAYFLCSQGRLWDGAEPIEADPETVVTDDLSRFAGAIDDFIRGHAEDNPADGIYLLGEN